MENAPISASRLFLQNKVNFHLRYIYLSLFSLSLPYLPLKESLSLVSFHLSLFFSLPICCAQFALTEMIVDTRITLIDVTVFVTQQGHHDKHHVANLMTNSK